MKIDFTIEAQSAEINVSLISFDSFDAFDEMWEGTDKHQGGVTIKNPEATRGRWQYFVPRETSLAELASAYTAQGIHNASAEAYTALQYQLERDLCACDYGFRASVTVGDVEVVQDEYVGCCFSHSYLDDADLETTARAVWDECGCTAEVVSAAVNKVKEMLAAVPVLNAFVVNHT
ncbi:hypothetical protein [Aeromonas phage PS]|uniref:Uncharacterized protein n=1 Tax=Aeromonas phage PS TaxID=2723762 RepID=A0A6H0X6N6_9CAUD|nr:hypothetical protein [Aeromonas phage PS]